MGWTISWEEFTSCVDDFIAVSQDVGDGWAWQGDKDCPGAAFIVRKVKREAPEEFLLDQSSEEECPEDNDCSLSSNDPSTVEDLAGRRKEITWEYHVLYSISYSTPVLYFNAFTSDGRLLPLETLWKKLRSTVEEVLQDMRWEALSQQEHPVLRRPFFQLHPCKTADFLGKHESSSNNPVVTWLSSIGPAIGLHLSNSYCHLVLKN